MPTKKPSKKTQITAARREYASLTRAYHKAGQKAAGTPKNSKVRRDYGALKAARNRVGRTLGKLTGIHKGR
jgi:hypothetical protein